MAKRIAEGMFASCFRLRWAAALGLCAAMASGCATRNVAAPRTNGAAVPAGKIGTVFEAGQGGPKPFDPVIRDEGPLPSLGRKIALYPVNRIRDFLDLMGFHVGFGFGLDANLHATRALQFGGGMSVVSSLGYEHHQFGLCNETKSALTLLPFQMEKFNRQSAFGGYADYRSAADLPWRYHGFRDYWGFGGEGTLGVVSAGLELHPSQAVDLLTGIVGFDLSRDDLPSRWNYFRSINPKPGDLKAIRKIVLVPSRVVEDAWLRMEEDEGVGMFYERCPAEYFWGRIGTAAASGRDEDLAREYSRYLADSHFDIRRALMEAMERVIGVNLKWEMADVDTILRAYDAHSRIMENRWQKVRRLPRYADIAAYYGADAVLDIRVWEFGVRRTTLKDKAVMYLDLECKLIAYPSNKVIWQTRLNSTQRAKEGQRAVDFARHDGETLAREAREACQVIEALVQDLLIEKE